MGADPHNAKNSSIESEALQSFDHILMCAISHLSSEFRPMAIVPCPEKHARARCGRDSTSSGKLKPSV